MNLEQYVSIHTPTKAEYERAARAEVLAPIRYVNELTEAMESGFQIATEGWQERANCVGMGAIMLRGSDESLLERRDRESKARAVCAACVVQPQCLDYALSFVSVHDSGIWAGYDEVELRQLRKSSDRPA